MKFIKYEILKVGGCTSNFKNIVKIYNQSLAQYKPLNGLLHRTAMQFVTNATPPASEDGVFNCSEQLRLTVDSGAPSRMARSFTVHCQSELQGTVKNRSLLAGGVAFDILRCWKYDHLQTSEYSLQGKYKGK